MFLLIRSNTISFRDLLKIQLWGSPNILGWSIWGCYFQYLLWLISFFKQHCILNRVNFPLEFLFRIQPIHLNLDLFSLSRRFLSFDCRHINFLHFNTCSLYFRNRVNANTRTLHFRITLCLHYTLVKPFDSLITPNVLIGNHGFRLLECDLFGLHTSDHHFHRGFLFHELECLLEPVEICRDADLLKTAPA